MDSAFDDLSNALSAAFSKYRCVTAWLGYANVLFVGFGPDPLPPRTSDGQRSVPPYELQSSMADWRIGEVSAEAPRETAERAVEGLIGQSVRSWRLSPEGDLTIDFGNALELAITSSQENDPTLEEWWLCLPSSESIGIGTGGRLVRGHLHTSPPESG